MPSRRRPKTPAAEPPDPDGLRRLTAVVVVGLILLGVLVLHERFEAAHVMGIFVIFIGLIFMDGRLVRRRTPAAARDVLIDRIVE